MASSKEYLEYILEQLSELEDIKYRAMMGEYIIYYKEKVIGGIYDDRFLVKATKKAIDYVSEVQFQLPYEGAKEMYLKGLFETMYDELPFPKTKKKK